MEDKDSNIFTASHVMDDFKVFLKEKKLKLTPEREIILQVILEIEGHFDAEQLAADLLEQGCKASRATVYRSLELIEERGFIERVSLGSRNRVYETVVGRRRHNHLKCTVCGKVIEFYDEELTKHLKRICGEQGFTSTRHSLQMYGVCCEHGDCEPDDN